MLKLSEDFVPVKAAERVAMEMLAQQLREMEKGIKSLKDVVMRHLPESVDASGDTPEDELLDTTPMGKFSLSAASKVQSLSNEFADAKKSFTDLLQFFGEDTTMTPEAFFCTINTFVSMFDQTHKELKRKEEAKVKCLVVSCLDAQSNLNLTFHDFIATPISSSHLKERKKRIEEKRKLREAEMAAKKIKS